MDALSFFFGKEGTMERILWVDEDPDLLNLYQDEFTEEGYEVVPVRDGIEALAEFEKEPPHLVIMELFPPIIDGIQAMIAMLSKNRRIPVILNTSYLHYREKFLDWGVTAYVIESSDFTELKKKIREALDNRGKTLEKNKRNFRWLETQSVG